MSLNGNPQLHLCRFFLQRFLCCCWFKAIKYSSSRVIPPYVDIMGTFMSTIISHLSKLFTCVNAPISKVSPAFAMPGAVDPVSGIIYSMVLVVVEVIDGSLTMWNGWTSEQTPASYCAFIKARVQVIFVQKDLKRATSSPPSKDVKLALSTKVCKLSIIII